VGTSGGRLIDPPAHRSGVPHTHGADRSALRCMKHFPPFPHQKKKKLPLGIGIAWEWYIIREATWDGGQGCKLVIKTVTESRNRGGILRLLPDDSHTHYDAL